MTDVPPPGGYPQQPGGYQPPPQPPQPPQQPPAYQPPPAAPQPPGGYAPPPGGYQQPAPGQFQPVNPPPASSSNGCLKAFLIVMAISVILGIGVTIFVIAVVGKAVDDVSRSFGVANASDYEINSGDIKCTVSDFGLMKASGTLTNKKSGRQAYEVKIDFTDESGTKLADGIAFTGELSSGQKGTWDATGTDTAASGKPINCKVAEVDYTIFSTK